MSNSNQQRVKWNKDSDKYLKKQGSAHFGAAISARPLRRGMTEIATIRQKEKMMNDGFLYIFDKFNVDISMKFWRCESKDECRGRIHTDLNNNFVKMAIVFEQ
ncbi:hypothetical protein niasHT_002559 [Heterodera trifolii]|uniref:FLYWCH-type domain-containing protein n=1 Tax=Heterodera trifolii TaxID=157864 RepID=A0ABD2LV13_9BILA